MRLFILFTRLFDTFCRTLHIRSCRIQLYLASMLWIWLIQTRVYKNYECSTKWRRLSRIHSTFLLKKPLLLPVRRMVFFLSQTCHIKKCSAYSMEYNDKPINASSPYYGICRNRTLLRHFWDVSKTKQNKYLPWTMV